MVPGFKPNGGKGVKQSASYRAGSAACNTALNTLAKDGRVLLFRKSDLPPEVLSSLHISTVIRAVKHGNSLGRTCLNLSYSNKKFSPLSVNAGTDLARSDLLYVPPQLPTLASISGDIEGIRALHGGENILGGTADVDQAYCRNVASVESAKLRCTLMECDEEPGGIVVIYIVCIFGDTRAGHVYNIISRAIDHGHNRGQRCRRSSTYVDDGIIYGPESVVYDSQAEYLRWIKLLFGVEGISERKISPLTQDLVAIGWHWNLREDEWNVGPKRRALMKIYIAVFFMIRPDDTKVGATRGIPRCVLLHVCGLLMWYCAVLPMGRSFVMSILRCAGAGKWKREPCRLSPQAKSDVEWWRVMIVLALKHSHVMRVPINLIADTKVADCLLQTDASTSVGGGGWVTKLDDRDTILRTAVIRWTREELELFLGAGADINVLEFFVAAALIMSWGDLFAGKKVLVKVDNMSAKKWLVSNRFTEKAAWANAFMSMFSIYCAVRKIYVVAAHVSGILNVLADELSRLLSLQESWCREALKDGLNSKVTSKGTLCREFFKICAESRSVVPLPELLAMVNGLLEMDGIDSASL